MRQIESTSACYRCGRKHSPVTCPARAWECFSCHHVGNTRTVCRRNKSVHKLEIGQFSRNEDQELGQIKSKADNSLKTKLMIEGKEMLFEIDLGARKTVCHKSDY